MEWWAKIWRSNLQTWTARRTSVGGFLPPWGALKHLEATTVGALILLYHPSSLDNCSFLRHAYPWLLGCRTGLGAIQRSKISWTGTQHAMKSFDWGWEKESRTGACAAEPKLITHSLFYWKQTSCLSLTQILTPGPSVKKTVMKITLSKAGGCNSEKSSMLCWDVRPWHLVWFLGRM